MTTVSSRAGALAIDAGRRSTALVLMRSGDGYAVGEVGSDGHGDGVDLTRPSARPAAATVQSARRCSRRLGEGDLARWRSLGLALTCADLVGVMRGALALATDYARDAAASTA